jgi:arylsulfatase A-like enzyme
VRLPAPRLRRALGLVALAFAACARPSERATARPNLVLVSIDTLRADHLGAYGYGRATSPSIDRLAREGVVFERAYSTSNWTLPAHVSMLTGLYPTRHGAHHPRRAPAAEVGLLPEALGRRGYRSAAVVSTVAFLEKKYGLARGFEVYDDESAFPARFPEASRFVSSERVHARAVELLDELGDGGAPFFLFLHYFDVHADYVPPPPFDRMFAPGDGVRLDLPESEEPRRGHAERLAALYDGEIRWVDSWIGRLLDELDRRDLAGRTLVVVTADHGEEFLEHGDWLHGRNLYDTSMRVPLVVRFPGGAHAGRRVTAPVSLVDLGATLLAAAGAGDGSWQSGIDLAPLAAGAASAPRALVAFGNGGIRKFLSAIVADGRKAVFEARGSGRPTGEPVVLVRTEGDPLERRLEPGSSRAGRRLGARLRRIWAEQARGAPRAVELPKPGGEEEAGLRALGYL